MFFIAEIIGIPDQSLSMIFSVAKATLQPPMSYNGVVILKHGCGYIQNGVVILHMVRLYSKWCGYIAQNPFQRSLSSAITSIPHTIYTPFLSPF